METLGDFKRVDTTAKRIKEAMKNAGKKQIDIVRETGIDKGALSHYLKGSYEPKQDVIHKIAKALDVSEMWLWGYDCPMIRPEVQKENDLMADIIIRMRSDHEFLCVVETVYKLNAEQMVSVKKLLNAFLK